MAPVMFHFNPETGETGRCIARKGGCPFGGKSGAENHFFTRREAKAAGEANLATKHSALAAPARKRTPAKNTAPKPPAKVSQELAPGGGGAHSHHEALSGEHLPLEVGLVGLHPPDRLVDPPQGGHGELLREEGANAVFLSQARRLKEEQAAADAESARLWATIADEIRRLNESIAPGLAKQAALKQAAQVAEVRLARETLEREGVEALKDEDKARFLYTAADNLDNQHFKDAGETYQRFEKTWDTMPGLDKHVHFKFGLLALPERDAEDAIRVTPLEVEFPKGFKAPRANYFQEMGAHLEAVTAVQAKLLKREATVGFMEDSFGEHGIHQLKRREDGTWAYGQTVYGSWREQETFSTAGDALEWASTRVTYGATEEWEKAHPSSPDDEDDSYYY